MHCISCCFVNYRHENSSTQAFIGDAEAGRLIVKDSSKVPDVWTALMVIFGDPGRI